MELVRWAKGVAVYEMPASGCDAGALAALAERAMAAAAETAGGTPLATSELSARFERPVSGEVVCAEAIVMRRDGWAVLVEADVLCDGERVATFAARCAPQLRTAGQLEAVA